MAVDSSAIVPLLLLFDVDVGMVERATRDARETQGEKEISGT